MMSHSDSFPCKILFVASSCRGHIEAFHLPYLEWLRREGYETHVAAHREGNGKVSLPGCDVFHEIPFDRNPLSPRNFIAYRRLRHLIREENFALIHAHTPVGGILARLAARGARKKGTKVLYTAHGFCFYRGASFLRLTLYKALEKWCARFTDRLITINREDDAWARRHMKCPVEYVPGVGFDPARYFAEKGGGDAVRKACHILPEAFVLLSAGRLDRNKNHCTVLRASQLLMEKHPEKQIHVLIAGEGKRRRSLERLARRLNIADHVHFLGFRTDMPAVYAAADAVLHLSYTEGLPRTVMEAMAAGLPVIASNVRGNRDLVNDECGFLVGVRDADAACSALCMLLDHPELRVGLSKAAIRRAAEFSYKRVMPEMERIYRSCLSSRPRVLHVLASRRFYGAEHVVGDIIELFKTQDEVEMAYASPNGPVAEALVARNIPFYPMRKLSVPELARVIQIFRPTVLHTHDVRAAIIASRFVGRCRLISTIHVNSPSMWKKTLKSWLFFLVSKHYSHIFWVNRSSMESYAYAERIREKSRYLPNRVDVEAIRRAAEAPAASVYDGVYVGRLEEQKDPMRLIRLMAGVAERRPETRFAILGAGSLRERTEAYARTLGVAEHIDFLGYVENPYPILHHARVMLMSSRYEGLPMCALEAGALGVPIVAVPADGLREAVIEGKTGFLSDDDENLIRFAVNLMEDDVLYNRIHHTALLFAEERNDAVAYREVLHKVYFS